jgi:N-acetylglucosamine-6-phosphate deacetylase
MSAGERLLLVARLFDGARLLENRYVHCRDGRVFATGPSAEAPSLPVAGRYGEDTIVAPGLVDLQVNGGGDVLLNDDPTPEGIARIAAAHRRLGTAFLLPTLITDHRPVVAAAVAAVREAILRGVPGVIGIHLEGPFISPLRPGIHDPARIAAFRPEDIDLLAGLGPAGVTMVTLAPETVPEGAIRALRRRGVIVMAGHSEASFERTVAALDEGLCGFTHLFNAMPPVAGRAPGIAGAALACRRGFAGLIADGRHIAGGSLRLALAARGASRCFLVSDAMPTVGGERPWFEIGGRRVSLVDGVPTGPDGTLGGCNVPLGQAIVFAQAAGVPLPTALALATRQPARLVGRFPELGGIRPGSAEAFTLLDANGGCAALAGGR